MGITAAVVAVGGLAYSVYESGQARKEQKRAGNEQRAQNKAESMRERRMQLREERVRRAALLQSSEAVGASASSGEIGAIGGLSTNLGDNIATNIGRLQTAKNISIFQQNAADALNRAETGRAVSNLSSSISSFGGSSGKTGKTS